MQIASRLGGSPGAEDRGWAGRSAAAPSGGPSDRGAADWDTDGGGAVPEGGPFCSAAPGVLPARDRASSQAVQPGERMAGF